ncbi:hypothetical protein DPMN_112121 [Dreissena polymorpha]|uniref:Uncharacterized protein n=1 Tax=Dreissena polymorpha TaxID=45954 RepID=A0A9D4QPP9_DREPO|nr:hypothetical protein DPMN_112121 [Dreissena polymorpha]
MTLVDFRYGVGFSVQCSPNISLEHAELTIHVSSRVITMINYPTPGSYVFQQTGTIFELIQDSIKTNVLTKCYEDLTINVTFRVITSFYYCHIMNKKPSETENFLGEHTIAPPNVGHVFQPTGTIFKLVQDIIGTNLVTKFHEDRTTNVGPRVKNGPPPGVHDFQPTGTIFELGQDIIWINRLTNFHDDRTFNEASRVLTRKNAPPPGGHVFQPTGTIFILVQDILKIKHLTKFHDDRTINVVSTISGKMPCHLAAMFFNQPDTFVFELVQDIISTNLLTKFHENRTINLASRL